MAHHVPPLSEVNTSVVESWSRTHSKVSNFSHVWTIDNFSFYCNISDVLESAAFTINNMSEWYLKMHFEERDDDTIVVILNLVSCNDFEARAKYTFYILNFEREKVVGQEYIAMYFNEGDQGSRCCFNRKLLVDSIKQLPVNQLTIFCEGSVLTDISDISGQRHTAQFNIPECRLFQNLGQLLENGEFSDVTFRVYGREIQAHKAILAAQSPVFLEMFKQDIKVTKEIHVDISNIDYNIMKEMLRFIYTEKVENLEQIAKDLFIVANEYALEELKILCEKTLCINLTIENAAEMLVFADLHNSDVMKLQTIDFIIMHATHVMDTEYFKTVVIHNPDLIAAAFRVATQQIKSINCALKTSERTESS